MNMAIDLFILQPVYQYRSIKIDSYLKKNKKKNPALGQKNQFLAFLAAAARSKILEMSADAGAFLGGLPPCFEGATDATT